MIDRILEDAIEEYDGILPEESVESLVGRWRSRLKFHSCKIWQENMYAFLDFAAGNGYQPGMLVLRANQEEPFGPKNCYFSSRRNAPPPQALGGQSAQETPAERWDRCVYQFNRERVEAYRGTHAATDDATQRQQEPVVDCEWYQDEFCVNGDCPAVADYCPVTEHPELCRFRKPREDGE